MLPPPRSANLSGTLSCLYLAKSRAIEMKSHALTSMNHSLDVGGAI